MIENLTIKTIIGIIITIFLGALGSGLWELAIQPILKKLLRYILIGFTFGVKKLRDPIYQRISKGEEDNGPFVNLLVILIFLAFYQFYFDYNVDKFYIDVLSSLDSVVEKYDEKIGKEKSNPKNFQSDFFTYIIGFDHFFNQLNENTSTIKSTFKEANLIIKKYEKGKNFDDFVEEDKIILNKIREKLVYSNDSLRNSINQSKRILKGISYFLIAILSIILIFIFISQSFVNEAILYFKQVMLICKPYINHDDYDMFYSRLSLINYKEDFEKILDDLFKIADKNNIKFKKFKFF